MSALRILVIDDEPGIREGCRRVLAADGHDVAIAEDGAAGLQMFLAGRYDLVLVDLRMPGLSGMDLLGAMRDHDPDAVAIVITAYASLDTAVEATKRGAYDYLAKPFTPDELAAAISRATEHRKLLLEARRLREQRAHDLLALAGEQSRLRTIIDCMTDGLLVINRDHRIVLFNPAALSLLRQVELPVGAPAGEGLASKELAELIENALKTGGRTRISRELSPTPTEETVLLVTVAPVVDEAGEGLGVVAILRDVTALKQIERVKANFVNMVSHELRAPLSAMRGYLDLILEGFVGDDPEKERKMLLRMRSRADGLLALVDDLLTMSRLDQARVSRTIEPVVVQEILREVIQLFAPQAESQGLSLQADLQAEEISVMADREELPRVFTNLISNALKYNCPGGVIRVTADVIGRYARIAVQDTGLGIPAAALPHLGKEFYRVKTAATREIVGSGLGLSVVKRILQAHHGRLEVSTEEGKGSTFTVLIPITSAAQAVGSV